MLNNVVLYTYPDMCDQCVAEGRVKCWYFTETDNQVMDITDQLKRCNPTNPHELRSLVQTWNVMRLRTEQEAQARVCLPDNLKHKPTFTGKEIMGFI